MIMRNGQLLLLLAWATLTGSLLIMLGVFERLANALWQSYKFAGYETPGFVTLSARTGWLVAGAIGALVLVALVIRKLDTNSGRASKVAGYAIVASLTSFALYLLIAFSGLNQWRP
jgi:hypothetical protein